jgi:hypothetical protein
VLPKQDHDGGCPKFSVSPTHAHPSSAGMDDPCNMQHDLDIMDQAGGDSLDGHVTRRATFLEVMWVAAMRCLVLDGCSKE